VGDDGPLGIESQRAALVERWPDARVWVDAARSGRNARRPALRAMLAEVQRGDVVAVVRVDRLARCSRLAMALELQLEHTLGARIVSLTDGEGFPAEGTPDPMAVFQRRLSAAVAELQAAQAAAATTAAFKAKRAAGLHTTGVAPYGFRLVDGRLVEDDAEQRVCAAVLELTSNRPHAVTGGELATRLNRHGYVSRGGRPFTPSTALRLARRVASRMTGAAT
jgi:site-specific DNA recombinase